jgi:hypothetical protein
MLSSSSSDSSDEEIRPPIRRPPRPIMRGDPFTEYTEFQFKLRFRFSKIGAREILTLIEENLAHLNDRKRSNHSRVTTSDNSMVLRYSNVSNMHRGSGKRIKIFCL